MPATRSRDMIPQRMSYCIDLIVSFNADHRSQPSLWILPFPLSPLFRPLHAHSPSHHSIISLPTVLTPPAQILRSSPTSAHSLYHHYHVSLHQHTHLYHIHFPRPRLSFHHRPFLTHPHAVNPRVSTLSVDRRRAMTITSSVPRTLSSYSDASAARIDRLPRRKPLPHPMGQPRSNVRRICQRRSASSGSPSRQRSESIGRIWQRRRRRNTSSSIPITCIDPSAFATRTDACSGRRTSPPGASLSMTRRILSRSRLSFLWLPRGTMAAQRRRRLLQRGIIRFRFPTYIKGLPRARRLPPSFR